MQTAVQIAVLATLSVGALGVGYIMARSYWNEWQDYVRTPSTEISRHPARARIPGLTEVSFAAAGDPPVAAWYAPPSLLRAAVVLVHGVNADRSALLFESRLLAQAGFGILALDVPGQGASGGRTQWGIPERRAISAAVDWLGVRNEVDPSRIGAYGMSMGAYVLAQTAVIDPRIAAIILAASPNDVVEFNWLATSRWGILSQYPTYWALCAAGTPQDDCPRDIVGKIAPRPLLIVQGELDGLVPEWMARQLYAAAGEPKEIYVIRGAHHSDFSTVAPVEYGGRLVDFYRRTLTASSTNP